MNEVEPVLIDVDGNRLFPKDRVMLLRGTHKGELAKVTRIGLKDWKGRSGRTPRTCAVVEVFGNRWGPFGILGDGVRLLERATENMVKATESQAWLRVFRFSLSFYSKDAANPGVLRQHEKGAMVAATTSRGFEVWRAIRPGEKLIDEIGGASKVGVMIQGREEGTGRKVVMNIGQPAYLPFGVGIELGGQRVGRLDATESEIAMEGVVFRVFEVVSIEDTPSDG